MTTAAPPSPADVAQARVDDAVKRESMRIVPAPSADDLKTLVAKTNDIRGELNATNKESRDIIDLILCAFLAKGHVFVSGGAGSGKSQVLREALMRMPGKHFITQALADTDTQALMGPLSLPLLDQGIYEYAIDGHLLDVEFAYVDEFKDMSEQAQRAGLMAMNERQFPNGKTLLDIPLMSLVAATNFWTQDAETAAVMDRFMGRTVKREIATEQSFLEILDINLAKLAGRGKPVTPVTKLTMDELLSIQAAVAAVEMRTPERKLLAKVWEKARAEGVDASVRRYFEAVRLIMAHAVLRGSTHVAPADFQMLVHVLPNAEDEIDTVAQLLADFTGGSAESRKLHKDFEPLKSRLAALKGEGDAVKAEPDHETKVAKRKQFTSNMIDLAGDVHNFNDRVEMAIADAVKAQADPADLKALQAELRAMQEYIANAAVGL